MVDGRCSCSFQMSNLTVGLQKILSLLESDDLNVRIHAVKVVANLAAEGGLRFSKTSNNVTSSLPMYFQTCFIAIVLLNFYLCYSV